jgi:hypothetical protein
MRRFIRHPTSIPIEVRAGTPVDPSSAPPRSALLDVGFGGLAFNSVDALVPGAVVQVRIPFVQPAFETMARVLWCRRGDGGFRVGAEFLQAQDAFRARMVEQVCHIESYRQRVRVDEHRELSADDAAREWIARFAARFPAGGPGDPI